MAWTYSRVSRTYRNERGRVVSAARMRELRNQLADQISGEAKGLMARYAEGSLGLDQWALAFRDLLEAGNTAGYLLGAGGLNGADLMDYQRIGSLIRQQIPYAANFASELGAGRLSVEEATARAATYAGGAVRAFEEARATEAGIALPTYPTVDTTCRGNCRCYWEIDETDDGFDCTWVAVGDEATCDVCAERATLYNPLTVPAVA